MTNGFRAEGWAASGVLPPSEWAQSKTSLRSSDALPVEAREAIFSINGWLAKIGPNGESRGKLYEISSLQAAGETGSGSAERLLMTAAFQAQPFRERATGMNYVRARWLDTAVAQWMTPDIELYRDSSGLFAFCGADPVNCSDPTGTTSENQEKGMTGESSAVAKLKKRGVVVFYGGKTHPVQAGGADIFAYDPKNDQLYFIDDKNWQRARVYDVTSLDQNFESGPSKSRAIQAILESKLPNDLKKHLLAKIKGEEFKKAVTAAAPGSKVRGVGKRLRRKNIEFVKITDIGREPPKRRLRGLWALSVITVIFADDPIQAFAEEIDPFGIIQVSDPVWSSTEQEMADRGPQAENYKRRAAMEALIEKLEREDRELFAAEQEEARRANLLRLMSAVSGGR